MLSRPKSGWRGEIMASKQPKHEIDARWAALPALLCAAVLLQAASRQAPEKPEHIRGTVKSLQDGVLTVATSNGSMPIRIEPSTLIDRMVRSDRAQIAEAATSGSSPPGAQTTGVSDGRSPDRCVRLRRRHARRRESADRGSRFGGQRRSRVADLVAVPMRSCSKYDGLETSYPTRVLPRGAIAHGTP